MSIEFWEIWEECKDESNLDEVLRICKEKGVEDIGKFVSSSVRNYCYNRGYRKDNYKSDGKLRKENKELMMRLVELEKRVGGK